MNYRKGSISDADNICMLIEAAKEDMDRKGIYQWDSMYPTKDDFIKDIMDETLYIAENEDGIAGVYVISEEADEEYRKCSWQNADETACILHRFCIDPRFQNQGIGRQILKHVEKQAKEMSYESIRLDVFSKNPHALNLYIKSGYSERGFADWRKGRFLLMEKNIQEVER